MKPARTIITSTPRRRAQVTHHRPWLSSPNTSLKNRPSRRFNSSLAVDANPSSRNIEHSMINASTSHTTNYRLNSRKTGQLHYSLVSICLTQCYISPETETPLTEYQKLIDTGVLRGDDHQTRIIQKLQDLHDKLVDYNPPKIPDIQQSNSLVRLSISSSP